MNLKILAVAGIAGLALGAGAAQAMPVGTGLPAAGGVAATDGLVQNLHGRHDACIRGGAGYHRSPRHGLRIECRPPRPRGSYWHWRCDGPRCGWYHRSHRRWY